MLGRGLQGPARLETDPATGLLSGTPDAAGTEQVVVMVTIDREVRGLDEFLVGWGQEKLVGTRTERVGNDVQRFTLEVSDQVLLTGPVAEARMAHLVGLVPFLGWNKRPRRGDGRHVG